MTDVQPADAALLRVGAAILDGDANDAERWTARDHANTARLRASRIRALAKVLDEFALIDAPWHAEQAWLDAKADDRSEGQIVARKRIADLLALLCPPAPDPRPPEAR